MLATFALVVTTNCASAQSFQPATVAESVYPPANSGVFTSATHMNAYSYGGLNIDGVLQDLYVYTWDRGEAGGGGGFAVRAFTSGTPVDATATPTFEEVTPITFPASDASSIDAVILKWTDSIFIAVTYYDMLSQKFMLDFYRLDTIGTNQLSQVNYSGFPVELGTNLPSPTQPFGWIHVDAYGLDKYVVTYDASGEIICQAGDLNGAYGLGPSNPNAFVNTLFPPYKSSRPDVAIFSYPVTNEIIVFLCYQSENFRQLALTTIAFDTLYSAGLVVPSFIPGAVYRTNANGSFGLSRIDAPDLSNWRNCAVVVKDSDPILGKDYIRTIISNNHVISDIILNDASTLTSLGDISDANSNQASGDPVVAYDDLGTSIYYCWPFFNNSVQILGSDHAYIGLRINDDATLNGPSSDYWVVQDAPQLTSSSPAIALSTQNNKSPELFMAFAQYDNTNTWEFCGNKTVSWTASAFRPNGSTGLMDFESHSISLSPNPFNNSLRLELSNSTNEICQLYIYDLLGRLVFDYKGNLQTINNQLSSRLSKLPTGNYVAKVNTADRFKTFNLVKVK
jgi:hypothetical protein